MFIANWQYVSLSPTDCPLQESCGIRRIFIIMWLCEYCLRLLSSIYRERYRYIVSALWDRVHVILQHTATSRQPRLSLCSESNTFLLRNYTLSYILRATFCFFKGWLLCLMQTFLSTFILHICWNVFLYEILENWCLGKMHELCTRPGVLSHEGGLTPWQILHESALFSPECRSHCSSLAIFSTLGLNNK